MRKLIYPIIGLLLLACGENVELTESTDTGTINTIDQERECACEDLGVNADSLFTLEDTLFTGMCFSSYPGTDIRYMEKHYLAGVLHGKVFIYDKEGNVIAEEEYTNGINTLSASESFVPCKCSELRVEEGVNGAPNKKYKNTLPFTGVCHEYFPGTEDVYMEISYQNGILHGYCKYYDVEGNQLYMEEYNKGVLEAVIN
ncbi:MAG: hypothetical protein MK078_07025 [Crocinitomicaceae bacterium]|nr:hypothetical protein [Crocinitomicaceae bacterium]